VQFHCVRYPMTRGPARGLAFFDLLYWTWTYDFAFSNSYKKAIFKDFFFKLVNFNKPKIHKIEIFVDMAYHCRTLNMPAIYCRLEPKSSVRRRLGIC